MMNDSIKAQRVYEVEGIKGPDKRRKRVSGIVWKGGRRSLKLCSASRDVGRTCCGYEWNNVGRSVVCIVWVVRSRGGGR